MVQAKRFLQSIITIMVYWLIFILLPITFLHKGLLTKDIGYYLIYFIAIVPILFLLYLLFYKLQFKDQLINYKKMLHVHWIIFILTYIIMLIYSYIYVYTHFYMSF